ncbi:MAG: MFS transporter [Spongiibacteraceae bacterium]
MSDSLSSISTQSSHPYPPAAVGWYATIMLAFLYWISVLDRYIISLLVDPIKRDLDLTDVQFGVLHGFAFVLTFVFFGGVFGALADRVNRRRLIYIGVTIWSIGTAFCGLAQNFTHLLLARVGVGAGESALQPCATSMISDLFPREKLTTAMAVYSIGSTVGSGTALIVGGVIVGIAAGMGDVVLPIVGLVRPWQIVFFIVGLPGLLLALSIFTVPEPVRHDRHQANTANRPWYVSYFDLWSFMKSKPRFYICHYGGFTLASAVITGNAAWLPAHMIRSFGWEAARVGWALGMTTMIGAIAGKLLCGVLVDMMYRRGRRDAQLRWYATCMLLATPVGILGMTSGNPYVFLIGHGLIQVLISPMPACAFSSLNLVTPNELRGTGIAIFTTVMGVIGAGAGSVLIAAISDHIYGGGATLGLGMATLIGLCCPLAALLLFLGFKSMREALVKAEAIPTKTPVLS